MDGGGGAEVVFDIDTLAVAAIPDQRGPQEASVVVAECRDRIAAGIELVFCTVDRQADRRARKCVRNREWLRPLGRHVSTEVTHHRYQ